MNRLLTFQYYFTTRPDSNFQYTTIVASVILALFVLAIALKIYQKKYAKDLVLKKIIKRYPATLFNMGIVLLVLLLSRETGIPFLSMRIWWFLLAAYFAYKLIKEALNFKKRYAQHTDPAQPTVKKDKYLPKKKKRRKKQI